ncbi:MAG: hypothetical protein NTU54_00820 [Candidatus Omnitrophica bacterium]|nr:hypothetical protein [Candidatus Omnitrophota bacterium]
MTAQDAGHLLEENSSYVVSSLKPQASASATDLLSMYNSGKILFKAGLESDFICISVKDKNSSRAVDICNAIASMLVDEGNKIYHREKNIVNMRIKSYEKEEGFIDQQLSLLKSSVSKRDLDSYVSQLQEMKDYYESKYGPLTNKIINSKAIFNRSEPFSRVEEAGNAVNYARLNLDQVFTILGSGLFLGIVFAFFQEFYINNFK